MASAVIEDEHRRIRAGQGSRAMDFAADRAGRPLNQPGLDPDARCGRMGQPVALQVETGTGLFD